MKRNQHCSIWLLATVLVFAVTNVSRAQSGTVPFYTEHLAPGAIGQLQNMKGRGIPGYAQPVKLVLPEGANIAPVLGGNFTDDMPAPQTFGCLIGACYRFRVTGIPFHPGAELYPTLEVIDRTYPPAGLELRYPIPVHITQQDLEYALAGKFVTRVIYIENPRTAIPDSNPEGTQPWFEVEPGADPVTTAHFMGRPVAILRMGSRRPTADDLPGEFTYQSPPIQIFDNAPEPPAGGVEVPMGPPANATAMPAQRGMMPGYSPAPYAGQPYAGQPYPGPVPYGIPATSMQPQAMSPSQR